MAEFKNILDTDPHTWTVAVGDLPDFYADPNGLELNWRGEGKSLENPILPSELRVVCRCDETHTAYISSISTLSTTGVTVAVSKDGELWWTGIMQTEGVQLQYDSGAGYWFEVTAVDGLALLKEKDYETDAGEQYEGKATYLEHIATCLKKLPYVPGTWSGADVFIRSALGWLAAQHTGSNDNPAAKTWINQRVWYDYDSKGDRKNTTCWEVLRNVLGCMAARIYQYEGAWIVEQPLVRNENTFPAYTYSYELAPTTSTLNGERNIECGSDSQRVAPGGHYDWLPALTEATYRWKARQRRNWLPGYNRKNTDANLRWDGETLDYSNGKVALKITAKLRVRLVNTSYTDFDSVWAKLNLYFKVGDLYLRRDIILNNGNLTPANYGWDATIQNYEVTSGLMPSPVIVPNFQTTVNLSFTTPVLPTTGSSGQFSFWIEYVGLYKAITGTSVSGMTVEWEFFDTYVEVLVDGRPINGSAMIDYTAKNPTDQWGETLEFETLLADQVDANDLGGLYAGTNATPSTLWGDFNGTKTLKLGNLWAERMIRFRKKPRLRMYTEFYGGYFPIYKRLNDGTVRWVMVSCTYTAGRDRLSGEWIALEKAGEVVTIRDPKTWDVDPTHLNGFPGPGLPPPDGPGTGGNDERVIPGLLYPLAANYTGAAMAAGAVATMTLKYPTAEGVFVEGDSWVVMDPATGKNVTVVVEETAEEGDTTVTVSGTSPDVIPPESMILYPLTNQTIVPTAAKRWRRWHGTVSGDELVLDATDYPLPFDHDRIWVYVEGSYYDMNISGPTYTVDNALNKIIFASTVLDGLSAVVRRT